MKRSLFLKTFCCLLAVSLLAGCKGDGTENSELNYWELTDCAIVSFDANHYGFANDQGKVLYYRQMGNYLGDRDIGHLEGTMECYHWFPIGTFSLSKGPFTGTAYVPYSKFLKVATRCPMPEDYTSRFAVTFVKDGVYEKNLSVTGKYEGQVTLRSDGTINLCGHNGEITVTYSMRKNEDDEGYLYYELCGVAEEYAEFFMGGTAGEIIVKGMAGNYTVTTYQDGVTEGEFSFTQERKPLRIREYDKDGNLLSTTDC